MATPPPAAAAAATAAAPAAAAAAGQQQEDDAAPINPADLNSDKIRTLMRRDPKFITRLIAGLDAQMHGALAEKHKRAEAVKADAAALARVDATIEGHVRPCLERLQRDIAAKEALRAQVAAQLEADMRRFKDMERDAAALISKVRHANSKLMSRTAQAALQEARGFTATIPTSELIRRKAPPSSSSGGDGGGSSSASGGRR